MLQQRAMLIFILSAAVLGCTQQSTDIAATVEQPKVEKPNDVTVRDIRDLAGIELGKEVVISECKKEKDYGMILYAMEGVDYPCFKDFRGARGTLKMEKDLPRGPEHNGVQPIELGSAAVPSGVSPTAMILVIDGRPEKVSLETEGVEVQERIYRLLVSKYGTPAHSNISQLQNAMGAQYQGIEASWQLASMSVLFIGLANRPTEGLIVATTPKGEEFFRDRQPKSSNSF